MKGTILSFNNGRILEYGVIEELLQRPNIVDQITGYTARDDHNHYTTVTYQPAELPHPSSTIHCTSTLSNLGLPNEDIDSFGERMSHSGVLKVMD